MKKKTLFLFVLLAFFTFSLAQEKKGLNLLSLTKKENTFFLKENPFDAPKKSLFWSIDSVLIKNQFERQYVGTYPLRTIGDSTAWKRTYFVPRITFVDSEFPYGIRYQYWGRFIIFF